MIIITTPTGDIGHQVLENVLQSGEAVCVIARDPARIPVILRERVEVVQGSHGDADVVNRAFAGADAVFWLRPSAPRAPSLEAAYVDFTRPACDAIKSQGVKRVVGISNLGRGSALAGQAGIVTASLAMDDLLAGTGANFRALTLPTFMDNLLREVDSIKNQGVFSSFLDGDKPAPKCATRDIAATASKLLLDSSWSGQGHLAVLGPEDLSFNDMAHIMSEVLERPVRYQQTSPDALKARLLESGMSQAFVEGYVEMMVAKNNGLDNAEPRTPENTTPTTFRQWCEEVLKPAVLS